MSLRGPSTISTPVRREDGTRVAGAERRERRDAGRHVSGDAAERQVAVDPQARHEIVGPERLVGDRVDRRAQLLDPRRVDGQARRLAMAAEPDEQVRAPLERAEHVEVRDAAAGPVSDPALDRQHDRRPMEGVHELAGDDPDHAAMPAFAGDDDDRERADVGIGLNDLLRRGQNLRFFRLAPHVLAVELRRQRLRASSAIVSSAASSSRVAMSGVLMRPAAFTRGASMNAMW